MTDKPNDFLAPLLSNLPTAENPHLDELVASIGDCVPDHATPQVEAFAHAATLVSRSGPFRVLDLGSGFGKTKAQFEALNPELTWNGIDISRRWDRRDRPLARASKKYNGVRIPFRRNTFDMVFSKQVFEHVRHPEPLLRDIRRVLKPGGVFAGSVSSMEPFHMASMFCFSPHGWKTINADAGLTVTFLGSGIDALSLGLWHFNRTAQQGKPFLQSNLNTAIDTLVERGDMGWRRANVLKVLHAGQMVFTAQKAW